jgi:hypothetical protein
VGGKGEDVAATDNRDQLGRFEAIRRRGDREFPNPPQSEKSGLAMRTRRKGWPAQHSEIETGTGELRHGKRDESENASVGRIRARARKGFADGGRPSQ